ncbi:uncharacterized [Tachysurus ichikawai]
MRTDTEVVPALSMRPSANQRAEDVHIRGNAAFLLPLALCCSSYGCRLMLDTRQRPDQSRRNDWVKCCQTLIKQLWNE